MINNFDFKYAHSVLHRNNIRCGSTLFSQCKLIYFAELLYSAHSFVFISSLVIQNGKQTPSSYEITKYKHVKNVSKDYLSSRNKSFSGIVTIQ